jgi:hypothetical protein
VPRDALILLLGLQAVLSVASQVLRELGLVGPGDALRYYINITTGDSLSIAAFVDDERFYQLKASEFIDLGKQYDDYRRAWSDYSAYVPRPLGYCARDGWSIMVSEGVPHVAIRRADVLRSRWRGAGDLAAQLWTYFGSRPCHGDVLSENDGQDALVSRLAAHFSSSGLSRVADACITQATALGIESMATRPQHGDFVLNNIGRAGDRLVVFDWEDYGKVSLPGLDIFTLCFSMLEGAGDALHSMMRPDIRLAPAAAVFLERACGGQGIDLAMFRRLAPFYLLVFLYLKRNYGASVQHRLTALLSKLCSAGEPGTASFPLEQPARGC